MTIVVKLGGSLLTLSGLAEKLRTVLEQRPNERCLIVCGGGASTDVVRGWSEIHQLNDEDSHWLALHSMQLNCELLQKLLGFRTVSCRADADRQWSGEQSPLLLDMADFARSEERSTTSTIPHDWSVTSDSLAAWAAIRWPADELLLVKSIDLPTATNVEAASQTELVDRYFPNLASSLKQVSWCNLRACKPEVRRWL